MRDGTQGGGGDRGKEAGSKVKGTKKKGEIVTIKQDEEGNEKVEKKDRTDGDTRETKWRE